MNLDFADVLGRAWRITWKHKVLWFFGFLASLGQGGSSAGNGSSYQASGRDVESWRISPGDMPRPLYDFFQGLRDRAPEIIALVIGLVCLLMLIGLAVYALSVIGRGGLIGGARLAEANGAVTFGEAWSLGVRHFWTVFLIGLLLGVLVLVVFLATLIPGILLTVGTFGVGLLCLIPLLCLLVPLALAVSVFSDIAQVAAVVENLSVGAALRRAWEVVRANLGAVIILAIILAVIGWLVSLVAALPLILAVLPVILSIIGFANENAPMGVGGLAFALVCCAAYLPVLWLIGAVLQTWVTSSWVLAFGSFTRPRAAAVPTLAPDFPAAGD